MSFIVLKTPVLLIICLEILLPLPQSQPLKTKRKKNQILHCLKTPVNLPKVNLCLRTIITEFFLWVTR